MFRKMFQKTTQTQSSCPSEWPRKARLESFRNEVCQALRELGVEKKHLTSWYDAIYNSGKLDIDLPLPGWTTLFRIHDALIPIYHDDIGIEEAARICCEMMEWNGDYQLVLDTSLQKPIFADMDAPNGTDFSASLRYNLDLCRETSPRWLTVKLVGEMWKIYQMSGYFEANCPLPELIAEKQIPQRASTALLCALSIALPKPSAYDCEEAVHRILDASANVITEILLLNLNASAHMYGD